MFKIVAISVTYFAVVFKIIAVSVTYFAVVFKIVAVSVTYFAVVFKIIAVSITYFAVVFKIVAVSAADKTCVSHIRFSCPLEREINIYLLIFKLIFFLLLYNCVALNINIYINDVDNILNNDYVSFGYFYKKKVNMATVSKQF